MYFGKLRLTHLLFVYTAIVLVAILCICSLALEKANLEKDLENSREESKQLREELVKINRYSAMYKTSPEIIAVVLRESERNAVDHRVMLELIKVESSFNPQAMSHDGARGLCQINLGTARNLAKEIGLDFEEQALFDASTNIRLGTYYLGRLLSQHNQDYHRALTAYNRGEKGLQKRLASRGTAQSTYSLRICRMLTTP